MYRAELGKIKRIMHAPNLVICTDRVLWTGPDLRLKLRPKVDQAELWFDSLNRIELIAVAKHVERPGQTIFFLITNKPNWTDINWSKTKSDQTNCFYIQLSKFKVFGIKPKLDHNNIFF